MNRLSRRTSLLVGVCAITSLVLAACSDDPDSTAAPTSTATGQDLVAAAEQDGAVLWYTSVPTVASEAVLGAFKAKYPKINVELYRASTAELWQRYQSENAANRNVADVVGFADFGIMNDAKKAGLLAKYRPKSVQAAVSGGSMPETAVDSEDFYFASRALLITIAYNGKTVPTDQAPTTWNDLLKPYWSSTGKIGILDPRKTTGTFFSYWAMDAAGFGEEFFKGLAKQKPRLYDQGGALGNALSSGEVDAAIVTDYSAWELIAKGQDFKVVYPAEGVGGSYDYVGVAAKAPHPNAGRLLAEFLGSPEGIDAIAKGLYTYMVDANTKPYPPSRPPLTQIKILPLDAAKAASERAEFYKKFEGWIS